MDSTGCLTGRAVLHELRDQRLLHEQLTLLFFRLPDPFLRICQICGNAVQVDR